MGWSGEFATGLIRVSIAMFAWESMGLSGAGYSMKWMVSGSEFCSRISLRSIQATVLKGKHVPGKVFPPPARATMPGSDLQLG